MKSDPIQGVVDATGDLRARVPGGVPVGEAKAILLVPETISRLLDALDALPSDPQSHRNWQDDAARIERDREE